jgi:hypothetical protein
MNIFRILLWIFLAIFIYKFVFNFLVPLIKVSWRVRSQIKQFQRQHQQDPLQHTTTTGQQAAAKNETAPKPKSGDYIDFEEVKD